MRIKNKSHKLGPMHSVSEKRGVDIAKLSHRLLWRFLKWKDQRR